MASMPMAWLIFRPRFSPAHQRGDIVRAGDLRDLVSGEAARRIVLGTAGRPLWPQDRAGAHILVIAGPPPRHGPVALYESIRGWAPILVIVFGLGPGFFHGREIWRGGNFMGQLRPRRKRGLYGRFLGV